MEHLEQTEEDIKVLLKKNLALSEDNNRMLRSLRNSARLQNLLRFVYIIIILIGLVWGYTFLRPYFEEVKGSYDTYKDGQSKMMEMINKYIPGRSQQ